MLMLLFVLPCGGDDLRLGVLLLLAAFFSGLYNGINIGYRRKATAGTKPIAALGIGSIYGRGKDVLIPVNS